MSSGDWTDERPLSPHLQVWKFHLTMLASILHRITGSALYFGSALIAAWIFALSLASQPNGDAPEFYQLIETIITSIFGQIILVLWAAAVLYHFANGIRHLLWDGPRIGFDPKVASIWSAGNIIFSVVGAGGIWVAASLL